ncbi:MAG: PilZ domain-containing protein [Verrucomicrobiota bacterium]
MSARKIEAGGGVRQDITVQSRQTRLNLPTESVVIHRNGIEFRSPAPFTPWTEMTVALQSPRDDSPIQCAGVVVACSGNKHTGYHVSMVFTSLTKHGQARLSAMAGSELGL